MNRSELPTSDQDRPIFRLRLCRLCRRQFAPAYANQQMHPECVREWRRRYQKRYQRRIRQEMREADAAYRVEAAGMRMEVST